ncbi:serine hydrolase [Siphonobacter sp. BAB-5385]|uniref:serine hydrolase domain-containing protein n=1 Tax=Siphonobacter sp. BAB-5385 TaxID=1864822 RepID=UPI000B9E15FD|nr:serine hydrolase [Siphonobacter sp. BAB-5385]OZI05796.1 serine hydrolase [Siphonobacter sp. BAB-5385]
MTLSRRTFLQQLGMHSAQLGLLSTLPAWQPAPGNALSRSTPEAQGVASQGILDFIATVEKEKLNVHSLMVLRHGQVIAEGWWAPYAADLKHTLYSLSKSFTSTAVGLAVAENRLRVEDPVIKFFPEDLPATVSPNLAAMRIKDLLTMSTGHAKDTTGPMAESPNWVKGFLAQPVEHQPGTHFVYNSGATYMLSAVVQKLTGQTLLDYLTPRLFKPLAIEGADWEVSPQGINTGGWGLRVKTEDIAKFGQLYLQKGVWKGKRLITEAWIDEATRFQVQSSGGSRPKETNDWLQGYGYQFWRCRHEGYRGDGAFGQYCLVLPKLDLVIAMTSETSNMQGIMDAAWNHILPSVGKSSPASAQSALKKRLTSLRLPLAEGTFSSPLSEQINGKTFQIQENSLGIQSVRMDVKKDSVQLTLKDTQGEDRIEAGLGRWKFGRTDLSTTPLKLTQTPVPGETVTPIATSGAWRNENTFDFLVRFIETAHYEIISLHFETGKVQVKFQRSLSILDGKPDRRPTLEGTLTA